MSHKQLNSMHAILQTSYYLIEIIITSKIICIPRWLKFEDVYGSSAARTTQQTGVRAERKRIHTCRPVNNLTWWVISRGNEIFLSYLVSPRRNSYSLLPTGMDITRTTVPWKVNRPRVKFITHPSTRGATRSPSQMRLLTRSADNSWQLLPSCSCGLLP